MNTDFITAFKKNTFTTLLCSAFIASFFTPFYTHAAENKNVSEVFTLTGHKDSVTSVVFDPKGNSFASSSLDGTIKFWNIQDGTNTRTIQLAAKVQTLAFSPDGSILASGMRQENGTNFPKVHFWNPNTGEELAAFKDISSSVRFLAFSPHGEHILIGSQKQTPSIWNVKSLEKEHMVDAAMTSATDAEYSPQGTLIVMSALTDMFSLFHADGSIENRLPHIAHSTYAVAFAPDGNSYAYAGESHDLEILPRSSHFVDSPSQHEEGWEGHRSYKGHTASINALAFSPHGKYIVSGSQDTTAIVWMANATTQKMAVLTGHTKPITSVAFSPDGKYIVTASEDATIKVWAVNF